MAINTSSTFGTDAQQSMKDKVLAKVVDTVRDHNPLLAIAMSKQDTFSGKQYRVALKYQDSSQGGSFSGLDTFSTNKINTRVSATFDPRFYYQSVVLEGTELSMARTAEEVIDFKMSKIEEAAHEMADWVGNLLHWDWTGNSNKDFLGLIAGADDGDNVDTYGGLSRGTYATWKGYVDDTAYTSGGTAYSLAALDTLIDAASNGQYRPDLILVSNEVFTILENLMPTPTMNFNPGTASSISTKPGRVDAITAYQGYERIFYRGIPVVRDSIMADGKKAAEDFLFVLNTDTWVFPTVRMANAEAMGLMKGNMEGGYDVTGSGISEIAPGFYMTEFVKPSNQYGEIAQIILGGNLICKNPRYNAYAQSVNG